MEEIVIKSKLQVYNLPNKNTVFVSNIDNSEDNLLIETYNQNNKLISSVKSKELYE